MRKSLLLGLGGAAILGGWVLKSYLESRGSANAGENSVAANAKNSAQGEKETFKSKLGEFSQKQFKCDFGSENSSLSENFTHKEKMKMRNLETSQEPYYDEGYEELLGLVESGKKPGQVLVDYLVAKDGRVGHNQLSRGAHILGEQGAARMDELADEADEICASIEQIGEEEFKRRVEAVLNDEDEA